MAGGLREYSESGSEDFAFHAGTAASNGIMAARLAAAGATSGPTALDGKAGFFRAYGEPGRDYAARLTRGLGERSRCSRSPTSRTRSASSIAGSFAAARNCASARAAPLVAITMRMHPFEADFFGVRFAGPFTTFPQTFMSAPFCAALAWARGDATLAGLTDFRRRGCSRPRAADHDRRRRRAALVTRRGSRRALSDGAALEWEERDAADAYLLTWDTACRMASVLATEVGVAPEETQQLVAAVRELDAASSVENVVDAMRAACRAAARER